MTQQPIACAATQDPRAWVVTPRGALDVDSSAVLADRLSEVIDSGARMIVADLHDVHFLDSSGIRVILHAAGALERRGGRLLIENAAGAVQRIFEVAGILEHLRRHANGEIVFSAVDTYQVTA